MVDLLPSILGLLLVFELFWFGVSVVLKRNDIADVLWGAGFVFVVSTALLLVDQVSARGWLMSCMVAIWGLRLTVRIYLKNRGKPEDFRYRKWREQWGATFLVRSFLQVFLLQGLLMVVVLTPVLQVIGSRGDGSLAWFDSIGLAVWLVGFIFEVVGDYQLDVFKNQPANKGKVIQSGLWRYSRHPNYFGEVTMWWGLYLLALPVVGGWYTVIGPLTITFLILKVSGVPLLEERYADNPDYQEYKRRTSMLIPLPPQSGKE